jgi:eukaryotic-like serine/threonine-protein kinase
MQPGTHLGPYEIQSAVGAGGMGEVYRARDTRLDRVVAIKVLLPSVASDPQRQERFDREARAISSLNHPHICTLYDVGHAGGIDYLAMELLDGQTLADRIAKGPLPLNRRSSTPRRLPTRSRRHTGEGSSIAI